MISLILDTDIGDDVDDVFALAYVARRPDVRLVGVSTVIGDTAWRAAIALRLFDELGVNDVPVCAGHAANSAGQMTRQPSRISGDVFVPLGAVDRRTDRRPVEEFVRDLAKSAPDPVWLGTIGPATNAAAAIRRFPEIRDRLAGIAMMGGRFEPENIGEYNFSTDAQAAVEVCGCGVPVVVGDFLVTRQAQLTRSDLSRISTAPGVGPSLATQLKTYLDRCDRDATSMYDPLSLTAALGVRYLSRHPKTFVASVEEGHVRFTPSAAPTNLHLAREADPAAFHEDLLRTIERSPAPNRA